MFHLTTNKRVNVFIRNSTRGVYHVKYTLLRYTLNYNYVLYNEDTDFISWHFTIMVNSLLQFVIQYIRVKLVQYLQKPHNNWLRHKKFFSSFTQSSYFEVYVQNSIWSTSSVTKIGSKKREKINKQLRIITADNSTTKNVVDDTNGKGHQRTNYK